MSKGAPVRSTAPQNVERGNREDERQARVDEMVTRLRKAGETAGIGRSVPIVPKPLQPAQTK